MGGKRIVFFPYGDTGISAQSLKIQYAPPGNLPSLTLPLPRFLTPPNVPSSYFSWFWLRFLMVSAQGLNSCPSVCFRSHARLRCMCTCNRCTFCICQNLLNSDLLQSVKNKLFTAVLNRSLILFTRYQLCLEIT